MTLEETKKVLINEIGKQCNRSEDFEEVAPIVRVIESLFDAYEKLSDLINSIESMLHDLCEQKIS